MLRLLLTLSLTKLHFSNSFQITARRHNVNKSILHMSSSRQTCRSSIKKVDFSGLTDELITRIASDLNLDKYISKTLADKSLSLATMTSQETRQLLVDFVEHHPDAERQVACLVMQNLGIHKSVFLTPQLSSITNESIEGAPSLTSSSVDLKQSIPLKHSEDDIMPNLSPVSWLSEDSWSSMSYNEKLGFMEHLMNGKFRR